jgi:hypothetical protein
MITDKRYNEILKITELRWFGYYALRLITQSVYHETLASIHYRIDTKDYTDDELITYVQKVEVIFGDYYREVVDIRVKHLRDRQEEYDKLHNFGEINL